MSWLDEAPHQRWLEAEGDRLLAFSRASRHPSGGFAWLDDRGRPQLDRPVELWITCRMTHVFALGHLMGRPGCGRLADHGVAALNDRLRDATNDGWYGAVSLGGPTSRDKAAYGHAFVVLAAASATCAGRPGGRALLDDSLTVLLGRFWDDDHGMVVEEWDESFTTLDDYRGVNANMHTVKVIQGKVADMYTVLQAARAFCYTVRQEPGPWWAAEPRAAGAQGLRVASSCGAPRRRPGWRARASRCYGGNGYINDYPLGRLWRDAKLYEIGAGTCEVRRMLIGRELFAETM